MHIFKVHLYHGMERSVILFSNNLVQVCMVVMQRQHYIIVCMCKYSLNTVRLNSERTICEILS